MNREARVVWAGLEFRKPAMLRIVDKLAEEQMHWVPPNGCNSIAWQVWHIAEVEDNWVRDILRGAPKRYPFGSSVRTASREQYPPKPSYWPIFTKSGRSAASAWKRPPRRTSTR